jgi:hypothetical protein
MVTMIMAMPCGLGEDARWPDAHQARRRGIVGGGPEGPAELGAIEKLVQPDDHQDAEAKVSSGSTPRLTPPIRGGCGKAPVGRRWLSARKALPEERSGAPQTAERDQQRRQNILAQRRLSTYFCNP